MSAYYEEPLSFKGPAQCLVLFPLKAVGEGPSSQVSHQLLLFGSLEEGAPPSIFRLGCSLGSHAEKLKSKVKMGLYRIYTGPVEALGQHTTTSVLPLHF